MVKNPIFYKRLIKEIEKKGMSVNQIERELGYPRNALHNYKNGTEPSGSRLLELATQLQLSPAYLLGKTVFPFPELRDGFEQLSESQKLEVFNLAHEWSLTQLKEKSHEKRMV